MRSELYINHYVLHCETPRYPETNRQRDVELKGWAMYIAVIQLWRMLFPGVCARIIVMMYAT